jgi:Transposase IS116/IS110/IS902 family
MSRDNISIVPRPTGHAGEPNPGSCRGIRHPLASGTEPNLYCASASGKRGNRRPVCRHARPRHGTCGRALSRRSDRCRHQEVNQGFQCLPTVDDDTWRWPSYSAGLHGGRRRSRTLQTVSRSGAYLGLVPRRYQFGEVDYTGSISKCGDRRMRTLLYEAANVMLTRYKGPLKLKDWALAIAKRSTLREARIALARRLAIIMHAMLRHRTEFKAT